MYAIYVLKKQNWYYVCVLMWKSFLIYIGNTKRKNKDFIYKFNAVFFLVEGWFEGYLNDLNCWPNGWASPFLGLKEVLMWFPFIEKNYFQQINVHIVKLWGDLDKMLVFCMFVENFKSNIAYNCRERFILK